MTSIEKNRLVGVSFLGLGFVHLTLLCMMLFGFSMSYPYFVNAPEHPAARLAAAKDDPTLHSRNETTAMPVIPGISDPNGVNPTIYPGASPANSSASPAAQENKAVTGARRTMSMIYIVLGIQFVVLLFVLFAGYTVLSLRAGGRVLGIVAGIFLLFFMPLGTVAGIFAIWFFIGDECLELYSEIEKDARAPQSII